MPESDHMIRNKVSLEAVIGMAKKRLFEEPRKYPITVVHHNDADGLSSAYILKNVFEREGFKTQFCCSERTYLRVFDEVFRQASGPVVVADLGATKEQQIKKISQGRLTIIIDHHKSGTPGGLMELDLIDDNFFVINSCNHGISGDDMASASTLSYAFAKEISLENKELAHIALVGAIGDRNHDNEEIGYQFKPDGYDMRAFADTDNTKFEFGKYHIMLNREWNDAEELAKQVVTLGSIGYLKGGPEFCLNKFFEKDHDDSEVEKRVGELTAKQLEAYDKAKKRIRENKGVISEDDIMYFDVGDVFAGMGTKTIGDFCEDLMGNATKEGLIDTAKYLMGGQTIEIASVFGKPINVPKEGEWVKVSIRASYELISDINEGRSLQIDELVSLGNPNYCDGCHERKGATVILKKAVPSCLELFQEKIKEFKKSKGIH
ncbi:DHH family phosphoesterase [Candidatus Woesearchaeota archaeon]|nr:DHH family phosphoesterase [Candidatus Woesearchaeota archaeon]